MIRSHSTNEALQAFSKAIDLASGATNEVRGTLTQALRNRGNLFKRLNRLTEAQTDFLSMVQIPARDPKAGPSLINLDQHYNAGFKENWQEDQLGDNLAELSTGVQTLAGTDFDVRGLIQLGNTHREGGALFPTNVSGVRLAMKFRRMHVLHGAIWAAELAGTEIGRYVLRFVNGATRELPIVLGQDVLDWWKEPDEDAAARGLVVAWQGANAVSRPLNKTIRLFKSVWENPFPDVEIDPH